MDIFKIIMSFFSELFSTLKGKQEFKTLTYEDRKELYKAQDVVDILEAKQDSIKKEADIKIEIVKQERRVEKKTRKIRKRDKKDV